MPICIGCDKHPNQIDEYVEAAAEEDMTPDDYVRAEDRTFNKRNGHFLCAECYIADGEPSLPTGWVAP